MHNGTRYKVQGRCCWKINTNKIHTQEGRSEKHTKTMRQTRVGMRVWPISTRRRQGTLSTLVVYFCTGLGSCYGS